MFWIFIGGGLGAVFRYLISCPINKKCIPWGTFLVNLSGAFLFGMLTNLVHNEEVKQFLIVGLCGGYTTFSTFAKEITFLDKKTSIIYTVVSMAFGLLAVIAGMNIVNFFS